MLPECCVFPVPGLKTKYLITTSPRELDCREGDGKLSSSSSTRTINVSVSLLAIFFASPRLAYDPIETSRSDELLKRSTTQRCILSGKINCEAKVVRILLNTFNLCNGSTGVGVGAASGFGSGSKISVVSGFDFSGIFLPD